jgi:ferric-dicitrate binding protein FerR (iron transport regulator)
MSKLKIAIQKSGRLNEDSLKLLKDCGLAINNGKDQFTVKKADLEIHTSWINGRIIFKHVPFNNIIRKLERHYNVEIINNDEVLGKDLITASFDIETIDQVFNVINEIHPIDYTIKDRKIIIN